MFLFNNQGNTRKYIQASILLSKKTGAYHDGLKENIKYLLVCCSNIHQQPHLPNILVPDYLNTQSLTKIYVYRFVMHLCLPIFLYQYLRKILTLKGLNNIESLEGILFFFSVQILANLRFCDKLYYLK